VFPDLHEPAEGREGRYRRGQHAAGRGQRPRLARRALEKRWDLDDIDYLDWHKVKAVKTVRGHEIAYDYEARQNLFFNIFIVIHFDGSYVMRSAGG